MTEFKWTKPRERAAKLLAEDVLTDEQIAAQVGVSARQLWTWKTAPAFADRIAGIVAAYADAIKDEGIANVKNRVAAQNDRWARMQRIIDQRAADPTLAGVPGGDTGLVVRQAKLVKVYESGPAPADLEDLDREPETLRSAKRDVLVYEYAVDTALAAEMRAHEKQSAQELGQWAEKREVTGDLLVRQYVGVAVEEV